MLWKHIKHWWKWNIHTPVRHLFGLKAKTDWISAYSYIARKIVPYLRDFRDNKRHGTPIFEGNPSDEERVERWKHIIDEMIFAMEHCADDDDTDCLIPNPDYNPNQKEFFKDCPPDENGLIPFEYNKDYGKEMLDSEAYQKKQERISEGLVLFGKYFQNLWD